MARLLVLATVLARKTGIPNPQVLFTAARP
jgi:hypothetical protein